MGNCAGRSLDPSLRAGPTGISRQSRWQPRERGDRQRRQAKATAAPRSPRRGPGSRRESDEAYVIDLCDELGEKAQRQHGFAWLLGDPGRGGGRRKLPVDAYYPEDRLVVEYQERQHDQSVAHFDKPEVMTVSDVHRSEQRRIYPRSRDGRLGAMKRPTDPTAGLFLR